VTGLLRASTWLAHGAALAVGALLLVSAGQPIFSEDTWWHLSMGEAYARAGPWLPSDPLLHTAKAPPAPAAWLFDLGLHAVQRALGFQGLRALHALLVAGILALAWRSLRRFGASPALASLGALAFGAISAYRLFQLRPHLLSIGLALVVLPLLLARREPPSWRRVALAAALFALWANLHGAFPVGLVLLGAGVGGLVLAAALASPPQRTRLAARAGRLAIALAACALATLLNPSGLHQLALYFVAGGETPALALVADEWAHVSLLAWPTPRVPPSPLSWVALWALLLGCVVATRRVMRLRAAPGADHAALDPALPADHAAFDPALLAVTAAAWVGLLSAVRLLWLCIVPLWWLAATLRGAGVRAAVACAAIGVIAVPAFVAWGDWPMISRGLSLASYAQPYPANKLDGHAVWLLADSGLEGNLFNDYDQGNFLGYWLAPRLRVFLNGSLNVPPAVMQARKAVRRHRPADAGAESLTALLDRYDVDVFLGSGLPVLPPPGRPDVHTTTHLEGEPGWILLFRNLRSAIYLRDVPRDRANLERVASYYARAGVPFDPARGFDPVAVIEAAPRWAFDHGLRPGTLPRIERAARGRAPEPRRAALERLGTFYAALGVYPRVVDVETRRLAVEPDAIPPRRRLLWSLLHLDRTAEALAAADALEARAAADDGLSRLLIAAARRCAVLPEPERAALVSLLPVFEPAELQRVLAGIRPAAPRPARRTAAIPGLPGAG
jgi:hypothetical protein